MAYVLVVKMTAREGEEHRAEQLIRQLVEHTRQEPGNNEYIAHRDPENPRVFLIYEQYPDQAAFEEHGQTPHFKELATGQLWDLLEGRERNFYETLD